MTKKLTALQEQTVSLTIDHRKDYREALLPDKLKHL